MKTFVLAGISAKFIHDNLALRYLAKYNDNQRRHRLLTAQFTINQPSGHILSEIVRLRPDVAMFSCYIWNIEQVRTIIRALRQVLPDCLVVLGGPEVTYDSGAFLADNPAADIIIRGEGEETVSALLDALETGGPLADIQGLTWRAADGGIRQTEDRPPLDMALLPFPYDADLADAADKIIYYESSRGCPYRCAYCLSSLEKTVRFRPLPLVYGDLQRFLDAGVRQVKFVDRTFNCRKSHTMGVWRYLAEHDNGVTNFHFELTADLLDAEMVAFLAGLRPGLFQFEIGVQSTNSQTIAAINRAVDFARIAPIVRAIKAAGNIHQHLDLIAGLPHEDYRSFGRSFDDVYALRPEQLQLGFLKVLKGSAMHQQRARHGLQYWQEAPYEVLATNVLPYSDLQRLKALEEMLERYYNSGKFQRVVDYVVPFWDSPFAFYQALGDYWQATGQAERSQSRIGLCDLLWDFCQGRPGFDPVRFQWLLKMDLCCHEKPRKLPAWLTVDNYRQYADRIIAFYRDPDNIRQYLPHYQGQDPKVIARQTHLEVFDLPVAAAAGPVPQAVLFDYSRRDILGNGRYRVVAFDR